MQTSSSAKPIARGDHVKPAKPASGKARKIIVRSTKPAKAVAASKPAVAVKPAKPAVATKPAAKLNAADLTSREQARAAAAKAVAAFYAGRSLPFKSASDLRRKAPINFALTRDPSARTAALLAAILTYCNVQSDGTFVRGSGRVPGKLLGLTGAAANETFSAGPESGCLSNCIPDRISYISGTNSGAGCENAIFRINYDAARSNMLAHNAKQSDGSHLFSGPLALLDKTITKRNATAKPAASVASTTKRGKRP